MQCAIDKRLIQRHVGDLTCTGPSATHIPLRQQQEERGGAVHQRLLLRWTEVYWNHCNIDVMAVNPGLNILKPSEVIADVKLSACIITVACLKHGQLLPVMLTQYQCLSSVSSRLSRLSASSSQQQSSAGQHTAQQAQQGLQVPLGQQVLPPTRLQPVQGSGLLATRPRPRAALCPEEPTRPTAHLLPRLQPATCCERLAGLCCCSRLSAKLHDKCVLAGKAMARTAAAVTIA